MEEKSLFEPLLDASGNILYYSFKWMCKPFSLACDAFSKIPNCLLFCCGFSLVIVPVVLAYWLILLGILLAELLLLLLLGFLQGLVFVLAGV